MGTVTVDQGIAARALPTSTADSAGVDPRYGRYGEAYNIPLLRKQHGLADEGSYFITNNGQTGILSSAAVAWVATTPALIVYNGDGVGGKRLYLDYLNLVTTVVGSAASGLVDVSFAIYTDTGNRYSSGGTEITANIVNPNMDVAARLSVAKVYFGALTASAASAQVRALVGLRIFRKTVSGTVADVVGEQKLVNFGGVEGLLNGSITIANANNIPVPVPPVILGPNTCALIYIWQNNGGTNVAATYAPELGWWER